MTIALQPGLPTSILQNIVYALPVQACVLASDAAVDVGQSLAGPWAAYTAGSFSAGSFLRCASANTIVTCKV